MRPNVALWLTLAGVMLVAACSSDQTLAPPSSAVQFSGASVPVCDVSQVTALINGLYPPGSQGQAHANFATVRSNMNSGREPEGRAAMFTLIKGTLLAFDRGQLRVSKKLGLTLDEGINQLGQQLYACAGMGASAPPNLGTILSDGGTAQVVEPSNDPNPQVVETDDGRAAASFPAGSVNQTLLVTVEPDPNGIYPFPETRLQQFQPFFNFSTFPHVDRFGAAVTVGICVAGDFSPGQFARLQLAHPDPATNHTTLEILHRVAPPPGICGQSGNSGPLGMQGSSLPLLAQRMVNWVLPSELQAALLVFGGVGGQTESFTDFRAVDPASHLSFTVQPSNTAEGATITPAVQVAVQTSDGQTLSSFHGNVTLALTGNPSATLSGTTTVATVNGVASFPDLSVDLAGTYRLDATALGTMDPVTGVADPTPRSDTSFTFVITRTGVPDGAVQDPRGDGGAGADVRYAWGTVQDGSVTLSVRFYGNTFSPADTYLLWSLDTDANPATGVQGITNGGGDAQYMGADFRVQVSGSDFGSAVTVIGAASSGDLTRTVFADGVDVTIPLSMLGQDDGNMNFKLTIQKQFTESSWSGINDFVTDLGTPAGVITAPVIIQ